MKNDNNKMSEITSYELIYDGDDDEEFLDFQCLNCFKTSIKEEMPMCDGDVYDFVHDCETDWFYCKCSWCERERGQAEYEAFIDEQISADLANHPKGCDCTGCLCW